MYSYRPEDVQNAVFGSQSDVMQYGDTLNDGQRVELESGAAQLLLANGVRIALEGPASIELTDTMTAKIEAGKLLARVPQGAVGFTIKTPTAIVVETDNGVASEGWEQTQGPIPNCPEYFEF